MVVVAAGIVLLVMVVVAAAAAVVAGGVAAILGVTAGVPVVGIVVLAGIAFATARLLTARLPGLVDGPGRARTATVVGAVLAGGALVAIDGGGRTGVAWGLALAVGAAAAVATRRPGRRGPRVGALRRNQDGAVSAEYVSVVLVVAVVVAVVVVLGLPGVVGAWGEFARCSLFGGDCTEPQAFDPGACTARTSSDRVRVEGAALVFEAARELGYDTTVSSDGTVEVTYRTEDSGGVGTGAGVSIRLDWDDRSGAAGAEWTASATASFAEGESWQYEGDDAQAQAAAWIDWHRVNTGGADLVVPGGRDSLLGALYGLGHEGVNGLLNALPGVDGMERPDAPAVSSVYLEAGTSGQVGGLIGAGDTGAGGDTETELFAEGSLAVDRALGVRIDRATGEMTAYMDLSSMLDADLAAGTDGDGLGWALTAGDQSVMELTFDADGALLSSAVTTYRVDEAGLELVGATDPAAAFGDSAFAQATASGDVDDLAPPSVYEVRAEVDLTRGGRDDLLGALAAAAGAQGALVPPNQAVRDVVLDDYYDAADITVAERQVDDRAWGGVVNAGALVQGGGGLTVSTSDSQVVAAHYYDPLQGQYVSWSGCVEAAG